MSAQTLDALRRVLMLAEPEREVSLRALARSWARAATPAATDGRAVALVLADLCQQGWRVEWKPGGIEVSPPSARPTHGESVADVKARQRAGLLAARRAQLTHPATRAFLRDMETPRLHGGRRVSVLDLIDDGASLARDLAAVAQLPEQDRTAALESVIRPSIHLVSVDAKCPWTGLRMLDVWRYFRHTWSLEYRSTPGRTLCLVIRNDARPMAPVMAIASLASALPQLGPRDEWIGWTSKAVAASLRGAPSAWPELHTTLLRTLRAARELVRDDDLRGGADEDPAAFEARLVEIAHSMVPDAAGHTPAAAVDWLVESETPRFTRKRARTLADLLFAERVLAAAPTEGVDAAAALARSPDLTRAVAVAMREVRKAGLASRLLDVNVCGAVQPYRDLLVGKLAALGLASEEVVRMYQSRYERRVSEIASRMAGRPVVREPEACVLTTTSLYAVAASQYNRLRLTVGANGQARTVEWHDLGLTRGFGTLHLGRETVDALRTAAARQRGLRSANNRFGDGTSARMRQVREALEDLGIPSDAILQHHGYRRVYALELRPGARRALRLNEPLTGALPSFNSIAGAWCERWLARRIASPEVLSRVAEQGPETVRRELADSSSEQLTLPLDGL